MSCFKLSTEDVTINSITREIFGVGELPFFFDVLFSIFMDFEVLLVLLRNFILDSCMLLNFFDIR